MYYSAILYIFNKSLGNSLNLIISFSILYRVSVAEDVANNSSDIYL